MKRSNLYACTKRSDCKNEELSPHFTLGELTKTNTGLENVPNAEQVNNLRRLCRWLERLRERWNEVYGDGDDPIIITSGFRSEAVNKAVGGVRNSNHLQGCAADIRCIGPEQAERYAKLLIGISKEFNEDFDELLVEVNARHVWWVHFAVRPNNNRRKLKQGACPRVCCICAQPFPRRHWREGGTDVARWDRKKPPEGLCVRTLGRLCLSQCLGRKVSIPLNFQSKTCPRDFSGSLWIGGR